MHRWHFNIKSGQFFMNPLTRIRRYHQFYISANFLVYDSSEHSIKLYCPINWFHEDKSDTLFISAGQHYSTISEVSPKLLRHNRWTLQILQDIKKVCIQKQTHQQLNYNVTFSKCRMSFPTLSISCDLGNHLSRLNGIRIV